MKQSFLTIKYAMPLRLIPMKVMNANDFCVTVVNVVLQWNWFWVNSAEVVISNWHPFHWFAVDIFNAMS